MTNGFEHVDHRTYQDFLGRYGRDNPIEAATVVKVNFRESVPGVSTESIAGEARIRGSATDLGPAASGDRQRESLYTVDVVSDSGRAFSDVTYLTPYGKTGGHGIYFVPEVNTRCLIARTDQNRAFVIGWFIETDDNRNYRGGRDNLLPGDYVLQTQGGAKIVLTSGGIVQVQTGPTCRRSYIPDEIFGNTIRDISTNYVLTTAGGQMIWSRSPDEQFTTMSIKSFDRLPDTGAGETELTTPFVGIQSGRHGIMQTGDLGDLITLRPDNIQDLIFTLTASAKSSVFADKSGNIMVSGILGARIGIFLGGEVPVTPTSDFEFHVPTSFLVDSKGVVTIKSAGETVADSTLFKTTGASKLGGVGGSRNRILRRGDIMIVPAVKTGGSIRRVLVKSSSLRSFAS